MISGLINSIKAGFQVAKPLAGHIGKGVQTAFNAARAGNFRPALTALAEGGKKARTAYQALPPESKKDFLKFAGATVAGGVVGSRVLGGNRQA